jgi:putative aldouronate transport system substrate-binding protein
MRSVRRIMALALAMLMIVLVFAGCNQGMTTTTQTGETTGTTAKPSETTKKFTKELKLSLININYYTQTPEVIPEDVVSPELAKITGVSWKSIEGLNDMDVHQRFNLLVQSNSLPDVLITDGGIAASELKKNNQIWLPSWDDFQTYAPEIANRLGPAERAVIMFDDNTFYGIPSMMSMSQYDLNINPQFAVAVDDWSVGKRDYIKLLVRDDVLKTLYPDAKSYAQLLELWKQKSYVLDESDVRIAGLETGDDVIDLLRKIKALGLKENGKDVIPFTSDANFFVETFGFIEGFYNDWAMANFNYNTSKAELWYDKPEYKAAYKKWNGAAKEGLLDPNGIVMKADQMTEQIQQGQYAVVSNSASDTTGIYTKELNTSMAAAGKSFQYRPIFIKVKKTPNFPGFYATGVGSSQYYLMNKNTLQQEDVYQLLNWANFQLTKEGIELLAWGPESAGLWEIGADGKRHYKTDVLENSAINFVNNPGEKNATYYGLAVGTWDTRFDYRFYSYYNAQYSVYSPRVLAWPLQSKGTEDEFLAYLPTVGAKTFLWWLDPVAGCFSSAVGEFADAMSAFYNAAAQVSSDVIPKMIFADSDAEFEEFFTKGHDLLYNENVWANAEKVWDRLYAEFHAKHPDLKPNPWPTTWPAD